METEKESKIPLDEYERAHGTPEEDPRNVNLGEGQNNGPPQDVPYRLTST